MKNDSKTSSDRNELTRRGFMSGIEAAASAATLYAPQRSDSAGAKRNRLFKTASKSLYSLYVGISGAHIA